MQYGEGDFQRAYFGFHNEDQANQAINTFVASTALSGVNWFRNNYQTIKSGLDTYHALKSKTKMARGKFRGRARRGRSRRYVKKRRFYRRGRGSLGRRIRGISRMLRAKGVNSAEVKYRDRQLSTQFLVYDPSVQGTNLLEGISQGTDNQQYLGRKVFIRHIKFGAIIQASDTLLIPDWVRILVVRDRRPDEDATPPSISEVYQQLSGWTTGSWTTAQLTKAAFMFKYVNNRQAGRFQIIANRFLRVQPIETGASGGHIQFRKRIMKPWHLDGANLVSGARGLGQLYLYLIGGVSATSTAIDCVWRVSYTDL